MTSILGLEENGTVYIGCDSMGAQEDYYFQVAERKLFHNGKMLFGYTSSFRMGQLLKYALEMPVHERGESDMHYLVTKFSTAVRSLFDTHGFLGKKDNQSEFGGDFLIGYHSHLYHFASDFCVLRSKQGILGVGAGGATACAALLAQEKHGHPADRVKKALVISEKFCHWVSGPFYVEQLEQG